MCVESLSVALTATFITFTVCSPSGRSAPVSGMIVPILSVLLVKPWLESEFVAQLADVVVVPPVVPRVVPPELPVEEDPVFPTLTTPPFES